MIIRCSSLDRIIACPGSTEPTEDYTLQTSSALSRLGNAFHDLAALKIVGQPYDIDLVAVKWGVSKKELEPLFWKGMRLFNEQREQFQTDLRTEVYYIGTYSDDRPVCLTGHIDVLGVNNTYGMLVIGDHKSGFLDGMHDNQLRGYGYLALQNSPKHDKVMTIQFNVREFTYDRYVYTRKQLDEWYTNMVAPVYGNVAVNPGGHCRFCSRRGQCRAYDELVVKSKQHLSDHFEKATPKQLYDAVLSMEKLAEAARQYLHDEAYVNGPLVYDDKYELMLRAQARNHINYGKALTILMEHMTPEEIASASSISQDAMKQIISDKHARGDKGRAIAGVYQQLSDAGALDSKITTQLVKRKRENEPDQQAIGTNEQLVSDPANEGLRKTV